MLETSKIKNLSTSELKGILFEYYTTTNNKVAYDDINKYSKEHVQKINNKISEERHVIQEKILEYIEEF